MSRSATAGLTALLLLAALPVAATSTRVLSMGGGGDYLEDVDNVQRWPGTLATYADLLLLELGNRNVTERSGQALGAHVSLDSAGRFGVAGLWVFDGGPEPDARLMWSLKRADWQIGLQYSIGNRFHANQRQDSWFERTMTQFGVGLRREIGSRTWIDLACEGSNTWDSMFLDYIPVLQDERDMDSFGLRWRLFHGLSERLVLVPCVVWERTLNHDGVERDWLGRYLSNGYDDFADDGVHYLNDTSTISGGMGLVLLPDPDRMLQASLTWSRTERELSDPAEGDAIALLGQDVSSTALTVRMGGEARVRHWLTVRGGVWKTMSMSDVSSRWRDTVFWSTDYHHFKDEAMDASLGLGLHLGDFLADLLITDSAPFRAGNLLTGTSGGDALWSKITLQVVF